MAEQFVYGKPEPQGVLEGVGSLFRPTRQRVLQAPSFKDVPVDMGFEGQVTRTTIPGRYGEPEFGLEYAPIVRGIASLLKDPKGTFKELAEAMSRVPERQIKSAIAMAQGLGGYIDPQTGEAVTYDPTLVPALTAAGTAASIARVADDGSAVLGIMGGRLAKDGERKFQQFTEAKDKGLDDRKAYAETKGYVEPSDNAFRFEIDTSNATLNKKYFEDSPLQDSAEGKPYQRFQFEKFTEKEERSPTLGDLMRFEDLYDQYPEIKNIKVERLPLGMFNTNAAYSPIDNIIYISSAGPRRMLSDLLHEVQHAVQNVEGFISGSNVQQYLPKGFEELRGVQRDKVNKLAEFYASKLERQAKEKGIDVKLRPLSMGKKAKLYFEGDSKAYGYEDLGKYSTMADLQDLKILADDFKKLEAMDAQVIQAGRMYLRQPGEVEARTVETKFLKNRQGEFPLDVQDVAPEDYIYRIDSND
tara:strand:- start:2 stop:1414 length:1413 start_codon:yes stop_codon:yes gene_type:complete